VDQFVAASTVCRVAAGPCDIVERCTGSSGACPADQFIIGGTVCRAATGACDVTERCDGSSAACPADGVAGAGTVCRAAAGTCDVAESCDGQGKDCPADARQPDGTACDDGNACTRTDRCRSGSCAGSDPVACTPVDGCHLAGSCDPATGACSSPVSPDNVACDDGNDCTTADSCHAGACGGLRVAGCCTVDADCGDAFACTEDRCVDHACMHVPLDERCAASPECTRSACAPGEAGADALGCVPRPAGDGGYCREDGDPCTIDACRTGVCEHEPDGSGPRCPMLANPLRAVLDLLLRARGLQTAVGCTGGSTACEVTSEVDANRLASLLDATATDLQTASLAIAGRVAGASSPETPRDATVRARLALGLLAGTPGELRAFVATLRQVRAKHAIAADLARAQRAEAMRLLRGTAKLRGQLQRVVMRRRSFAR
jgi:hypothetical protein